MAGHSKWANIKHRKGAQDKKRSNLFGKLSKQLTIAARDGKDPDMNIKLRLLIDKARNVNMPKDNIDRAIKKGAGELDGEVIEEIRYEGYGPGGIAIVVDVATDNKNRSAAEIRSIFTKYGGSLGASNSVMWMFEQKGVFHLEAATLNDEMSIQLLDNGAQDIKNEDAGYIIYTKPEDFQNVQNFLAKNNVEISYSGIDYIAENMIEITGEDGKEKFEKMIDAFDDNDDVTDVFTNATFV